MDRLVALKASRLLNKIGDVEMFRDCIVNWVELNSQEICIEEEIVNKITDLLNGVIDKYEQELRDL